MIKRTTIMLFLAVFINLLSAQSNVRSGLQMGVELRSGTHTNPYVHYSGSELVPTNLIGFEDVTTQVYFPFAWSVYSKDGFSEFSTSAGHLLIVGIANLLNSNKEYKFTTDKAYAGDSYADGYVPVFGDFEANTSQYWGTAPNKGIEASYGESDLFRFIYASNAFTESIKLPVLVGFQGGIGQIGVHFANVQEGSSPTEANTDGPGLTNFNDLTDLYYGANLGFASSITGTDLAVLSVQYDWFYFIKGVEENRGGGSRLTIEATYFPFENEGILGDLFFKAYYKSTTIPYMKKFNEIMPVDYKNSIIGLGVNLFLL